MSKLREILLLTENLHDNKAFSSKFAKKLRKGFVLLPAKMRKISSACSSGLFGM